MSVVSVGSVIHSDAEGSPTPCVSYVRDRALALAPLDNFDAQSDESYLGCNNSRISTISGSFEWVNTRSQLVGVSEFRYGRYSAAFYMSMDGFTLREPDPTHISRYGE